MFEIFGLEPRFGNPGLEIQVLNSKIGGLVSNPKFGVLNFGPWSFQCSEFAALLIFVVKGGTSICCPGRKELHIIIWPGARALGPEFGGRGPGPKTPRRVYQAPRRVHLVDPRRGYTGPGPL